ncbi:phytanoyl-CoA dioxygenase family protein [Aureisphaera galaxeae]|uniref:phytanoyl-CoA dioxygenase family protein n=1 Tax=Aureisphaera galaxeae TaxID=1538023 RepID=UPI002350E938|nr:phytanoyl-CoA dioxygenase family protein [Aureisphaera galaxeae]MDC8004851.1 phytanoyl-CoA dioxygenase family protein [Aureisphaera galaxeae]
MSFNKTLAAFRKDGYAIIPNFYSDAEIESLISDLEEYGNDVADQNSKHLFAIRQLLNRIPELKVSLFNANLKRLLTEYYEKPSWLTKAIYFDKPSTSNWFVAYHQDLSISVKEKIEVDGYKNWTHKKGQYGVQPPTKVLENTITLRIHLDDTTEENGALKVIPKSHGQGIQRNDHLGITQENEVTCAVPKGGIMLMSPLTLHASHRTTNGKRRRVIHLEFCPQTLQTPLEWLEAQAV